MAHKIQNKTHKKLQLSKSKYVDAYSNIVVEDKDITPNMRHMAELGVISIVPYTSTKRSVDIKKAKVVLEKQKEREEMIKALRNKKRQTKSSKK